MRVAIRHWQLGNVERLRFDAGIIAGIQSEFAQLFQSAHVSRR